MILYMVMKVKKWEDMKFETDIFRLKVEEWDYGYCHVFTDYDKAMEVAGDPNRVKAMREVD